MSRLSSVRFAACISFFLAAACPIFPQQGPESFHWVDFHSTKDQSVVDWVTRSLAAENWTAIREIGVEYDAALVVTTSRSNPQGPSTYDTFTVWNASLTRHTTTRLLQGADLRLLSWLQLASGHPRELAAFYDDCTNCNASTFFTAFYYDLSQHAWAARWLHGNQAVTVRSVTPPPGVAWTQVFAVFANPNGDEAAVAWTHFDYGTQKPPVDYIYQYDVDPWTNLDRVQIANDKQVVPTEQRLCSAQDTVPAFNIGQDSQLCRALLHPESARDKEKPCRCRTGGLPASGRK